MTQDPKIPALVESALQASISALQFCNNMIHEPMRVLVEHLWDKCCSKPSEGASILLINKIDIVRGAENSGLAGKLVYVPGDLRNKLTYSDRIDSELDKAVFDKSCVLNRVAGPSFVVDLDLLQFSGKMHEQLLASLEASMGGIVELLRDAGDDKVSLATMPEISVGSGDTPIRVVVHMYGWMGVMDA